MRIGIVGCGFIGRVHGWALWAVRKAKQASFEIAAVWDRDAERAAAFASDVRSAVRPLDEVIERCDVVYVCTPTAEHAVVVELAADAGKAIFCEKPLAPNLAQAERVASALHRVPHQVGLVLRFSPVFNALRDEIASGRYGAPMVATMRDDQYFPIQGQYGSDWRADLSVAGGGTLIEHSIHDVDMFRFLFGDASDVACRTSSFFGHDGIDDLAVATFGFGRTVVNLTSVWHQVMTRPSTRRLEVFCELGHLWLEDDNCGPLHIETSSGAEVRECPPAPWAKDLPVPDDRRPALALYGEATRRFLECVSSGRFGSPGADEALAAHRLVDAAYRSAAAGGAPISTTERS